MFPGRMVAAPGMAVNTILALFHQALQLLLGHGQKPLKHEEVLIPAPSPTSLPQPDGLLGHPQHPAQLGLGDAQVRP